MEPSGIEDVKKNAHKLLGHHLSNVEEKRNNQLYSAIELQVRELYDMVVKKSQQIVESEDNVKEAFSTMQKQTDVTDLYRDKIYGLISSDLKSQTENKERVRQTEVHMDFLTKQLERREIFATDQRKTLMKEIIVLREQLWQKEQNAGGGGSFMALNDLAAEHDDVINKLGEDAANLNHILGHMLGGNAEQNDKFKKFAAKIKREVALQVEKALHRKGKDHKNELAEQQSLIQDLKQTIDTLKATQRKQIHSQKKELDRTFTDWKHKATWEFREAIANYSALLEKNMMYGYDTCSAMTEASEENYYVLMRTTVALERMERERDKYEKMSNKLRDDVKALSSMMRAADITPPGSHSPSSSRAESPEDPELDQSGILRGRPPTRLSEHKLKKHTAASDVSSRAGTPITGTASPTTGHTKPKPFDDSNLETMSGVSGSTVAVGGTQASPLSITGRPSFEQSSILSPNKNGPISPDHPDIKALIAKYESEVGATNKIRNNLQDELLHTKQLNEKLKRDLIHKDNQISKLQNQVQQLKMELKDRSVVTYTASTSETYDKLKLLLKTKNEEIATIENKIRDEMAQNQDLTLQGSKEASIMHRELQVTQDKLSQQTHQIQQLQKLLADALKKDAEIQMLHAKELHLLQKDSLNVSKRSSIPMDESQYRRLSTGMTRMDVDTGAVSVPSATLGGNPTTSSSSASDTHHTDNEKDNEKDAGGVGATLTTTETQTESDISGQQHHPKPVQSVGTYTDPSTDEGSGGGVFGDQYIQHVYPSYDSIHKMSVPDGSSLSSYSVVSRLHPIGIDTTKEGEGDEGGASSSGSAAQYYDLERNSVDSLGSSHTPRRVSSSSITTADQQLGVHTIHGVHGVVVHPHHGSRGSVSSTHSLPSSSTRGADGELLQPYQPYLVLPERGSSGTNNNTRSSISSDDVHMAAAAAQLSVALVGGRGGYSTVSDDDGATTDTQRLTEPDGFISSPLSPALSLLATATDQQSAGGGMQLLHTDHMNYRSLGLSEHIKFTLDNIERRKRILLFERQYLLLKVLRICNDWDTMEPKEHPQAHEEEAAGGTVVMAPLEGHDMLHIIQKANQTNRRWAEGDAVIYKLSAANPNFGARPDTPLHQNHLASTSRSLMSGQLPTPHDRSRSTSPVNRRSPQPHTTRPTTSRSPTPHHQQHPQRPPTAQQVRQRGGAPSSASTPTETTPGPLSPTPPPPPFGQLINNQVGHSNSGIVHTPSLPKMTNKNPARPHSAPRPKGQRGTTQQRLGRFGDMSVTDEVVTKVRPQSASTIRPQNQKSRIYISNNSTPIYRRPTSPFYEPTLASGSSTKPGEASTLLYKKRQRLQNSVVPSTLQAQF